METKEIEITISVRIKTVRWRQSWNWATMPIRQFRQDDLPSQNTITEFERATRDI
jgi:hypothetical protein